MAQNFINHFLKLKKSNDKQNLSTEDPYSDLAKIELPAKNLELIKTIQQELITHAIFEIDNLNHDQKEQMVKTETKKLVRSVLETIEHTPTPAELSDLLSDQVEFTDQILKNYFIVKKAEQSEKIKEIETKYRQAPNNNDKNNLEKKIFSKTKSKPVLSKTINSLKKISHKLDRLLDFKIGQLVEIGFDIANASEVSLKEFSLLFKKTARGHLSVGQIPTNLYQSIRQNFNEDTKNLTTKSLQLEEELDRIKKRDQIEQVNQELEKYDDALFSIDMLDQDHELILQDTEEAEDKLIAKFEKFHGENQIAHIYKRLSRWKQYVKTIKFIENFDCSSKPTRSIPRECEYITICRNSYQKLQNSLHPQTQKTKIIDDLQAKTINLLSLKEKHFDKDLISDVKYLIRHEISEIYNQNKHTLSFLRQICRSLNIYNLIKWEYYEESERYKKDEY